MTSDPGNGVDAPREAVDTVVLAMPAKRNRELLSEWLGSLPSYRVETAAEPADVPDEYDLCLVDRRLLETLRPTLCERREQSGSVFLPHLLVVPGTSGDDPQDVEPDFDSLFDDVMQFPIRKALLRRRLDNALRARHATTALATREQQYRNLVELTPETILLLDGETVVYANTAAARLFDTEDAAELEGESLTAFVGDEDRPRLRNVLDGIDEREGSGDEFVELPLLSTTGRELYVAIAGVKVTYDGRQMTQVIVRDLTTEKQRTQRLNLFGRAMEAAAQGITIADAKQPDYPIIYANRGFERITGYPVDKILGRNCRFLQGDNTTQATVAEIREAIEAERPVSTDILNYRYDGTPFWNRLDIVPVKDDAGEVTHYLGLQRDVTEQKETEQQLSVLNRVLRHNLRNKMNVIQLYADQLQKLPEAADTATSISEAAAELLAISEQIRKFDSVIAPDERDLEPLDLADLAVTGVRALRHRNPDVEITLSVPDSATILAHETLRPALSDLVTLSDAIEAPTLDVDITCEASTVTMSIVPRGDEVDTTELEIVAGEGETQLEHLESLELWLIRWAVEESRGEFLVDTEGDDPVLTLRFQRAEADT